MIPGAHGSGITAALTATELGIGDTPQVRLARVGAEGRTDVYVQLEAGKPTGSSNDRMGVSAIGRALEGADAGVAAVGRQITPATFAVRA